MDSVKEKLVELIRNAHKKCKTKKSCHECEQYGNGSDCAYRFIADELLANGVTFATDNNVGDKWISASEPPKKYRDEYGELIPFLVCLDGTEYPFRAMYDGKVWGDGWGKIPVTYWMPMPMPPKEENK